MKRFYWFPHRRPSYRAVETRDSLCAWRVHRRYRWLWFEFWWPVMAGPIPEVFYDELAARAYIDKMERMDGAKGCYYCDNGIDIPHAC